MSDSYEREQADKRRLWDHILVQVYGTTDLGEVKARYQDPEGHAFFMVLDMAFSSSDKMQGCVPVHRELVQYMAGWGRDVSKGYDERGGPLGPKANHFVKRGFDGFIETLRNAVKKNQLRYHDKDRVMYGCFVLPQWLLDKYLNEAQEQAEYLNEEWDKDSPGFRDFLRRWPDHPPFEVGL